MFVFDTKKTGQRLHTARTRQNMTQMALADQMGVSFQAVSNWERGNSMPDISKLEQLCAILEISLEDLLGSGSENAQTVRRLQKNELPEIESLAPIAPLVPPATLQASVSQTVQEHPLDWTILLGLVPFLEEDFVSELVCKQELQVPSEGLQSLAPFLNEAAMDHLALTAADVGDLYQLFGLAPFMSSKALGQLVLGQLEQADHTDTDALCVLYPFLTRDTVRLITRKLMEAGDLEAIRDAAPFL